MPQTTIFAARRIVTMDPNRPEATHVAVRAGRILAVGDADCADGWGGGQIDKRFRDAVLVPGFVEGHAHLMAGAMWRYPYVGFHDRVAPDGTPWAGLTDIGEVTARLKDIDASLPADTPLVAWGFDPIFLPTERLNCRHLDAVSASRPVIVMHSNFHVLTANSAVMRLVGYDRNPNIKGLVRFEDGTPNGEVQEMAAMFPILRRLGVDFRALARTADAIRDLGRTAVRVGVTTTADLFNDLPDADLDTLLAVTGGDEFPLRIVPALNGIARPPDEVAARARDLRKRSTDKLRLGAVKLMADGSIQAFTARLKWPGYLGGQQNGIWNMPPVQLARAIEVIHAAGVQMHIHVNGDEASETALDALEAALSKHPRGDHRHILQHCQMADAAQFVRMAALGVGCNLFSNHIWYFGDQHHDITLGPDRAARMDACRAALDAGVPLTVHSDAPVTPLGPLHTAWAAVNRITPSGRVLGAAQRLTPTEALHAVTLGAAWSLKLDHEIGSIACGKRADFAILAEDPLTVPAEEMRDIEVLGTVFGGRVFRP